jgi:hypothetical protein
MAEKTILEKAGAVVGFGMAWQKIRRARSKPPSAFPGPRFGCRLGGLGLVGDYQRSCGASGLAPDFHCLWRHESGLSPQKSLYVLEK